ncbi:MAG: GNAT family N-acetyltransferase [Elusimicrobiota bacterium]|nr:GNAT family N-acetyltransferase [Elusimicrobiota bacterium]
MKQRSAITIGKVEHEDAAWKARFLVFYTGLRIRKLGRKPHAYFAARSGEELAGHSVVYFEKGRWVLDELMVKAEFREKGIAKGLTEARIRHVIVNGAKEIWYACEDGNLVTTCCHLRYGFEKICPGSHHCTAATAHWYRLKITPALFEKFPVLDPNPKIAAKKKRATEGKT